MQREKFASDASGAHGKLLSSLEEMKLLELGNVDLLTQIADGEVKLKTQQNLYEGVRADRNVYSKNLVAAQDEISEMRRKFKIMNQQVEQLKEEIGAKELKSITTPMEKVIADEPDDEEVGRQGKTCRIHIGGLLFLMRGSRPDLAY